MWDGFAVPHPGILQDGGSTASPLRRNVGGASRDHGGRVAMLAMNRGQFSGIHGLRDVHVVAGRERSRPILRPPVRRQRDGRRPPSPFASSARTLRIKE
jgi:hypothetical protein